jgi:hypothetical protein
MTCDYCQEEKFDSRLRPLPRIIKHCRVAQGQAPKMTSNLQAAVNKSMRSEDAPIHRPDAQTRVLRLHCYGRAGPTRVL